MNSEIMAMGLSQIGICITVFVTVQFAGRRIVSKHFFLGLAVSEFFQTVAAWMALRWMAPVNAAVVVVNLWFWWNSGGDDDTKKRLRKLRRKFQPVRRMAPVTA